MELLVIFSGLSICALAVGMHISQYAGWMVLGCGLMAYGSLIGLLRYLSPRGVG